MGTWNNDYNKTPRNGYNPGYGAQEVRLLKTNITDRLSKEHIFGDDETRLSLAGGKHKEGSAKAFSEDVRASVSERTDAKILDIGSVGQIFINVEPRAVGTELEVDTVPSTTSAAKNFHKIKVNSQLDSLVNSITKETIFDYDKIVNTEYDQVNSSAIRGIKEFINPVRIPDVTSSYLIKSSEDSSPAFPPFVDFATEQDSVPLGQIRAQLVDAKEHNILDGENAYNTTENIDGTKYTMQSISVQTIHAKNIYGVVWG